MLQHASTINSPKLHGQAPLFDDFSSLFHGLKSFIYQGLVGETVRNLHFFP
jgi:hypothetical protein